MNIYDYFQAKLGEFPNEASLRELPCNSVCGKDCVKVIDAFAKAKLLSDASAWPATLVAANRAVEAYWLG